MTYAYAADRARLRPADPHLTRHAVDDMAHFSGAKDTECGRPAPVLLGFWEPGNPDNCRRCTRILAAQERGVAA